MNPIATEPHPVKSLPDAALVRQVVERQPEALAELYSRHASTLLALARRKLTGKQCPSE